MRRKKTHVMPHRRKREGKTNYKKRLELLKSGKPRLVIRKSSNNITCQVVQYKIKGDATLASSDSRGLKKFGWKGHCGNLPAAYLTGFLCGKKAIKKKTVEVVLDFGLYQSTRGSRVYAALKGCMDAGMKIPHSESILPSAERERGKHIEDYGAALKKDSPEKYKKAFSKYLRNNIQPESLTKHFELVKGKIQKEV